MIVTIDGTRMDIKHRTAIVLQQLHDLGGEANTRDISSRSGLEGWMVNEAYKQAEERGLVEFTGYDDASYGPGSDPKMYELTGHGRLVIERGVVGKVIRLNENVTGKTATKEVENLREKVSRVEAKVDADSNSELAERFEEMRSRVDEADGLTDEEADDIRDDISDLESYVFEWNEAAEKYMRALRAALEDQGVDVQQYFDDDNTPTE